MRDEEAGPHLPCSQGLPYSQEVLFAPACPAGEGGKKGTRDGS